MVGAAPFYMRFFYLTRNKHIGVDKYAPCLIQIINNVPSLFVHKSGKIWELLKEIILPITCFKVVMIVKILEVWINTYSCILLTFLSMDSLFLQNIYYTPHKSKNTDVIHLIWKKYYIYFKSINLLFWSLKISNYGYNWYFLKPHKFSNYRIQKIGEFLNIFVNVWPADIVTGCSSSNV